jgi:2-polyprenyl-3-methyl-5-hydroxy-6-metoxy-1,4-benzoquinol methylase
MHNPEKFWNRMAGQFDKRAKQYELTHPETNGKIRKYLRDSDIVLDYGCATGRIAFELAPKVKMIHGIDFSHKMIDLAKRNADENIIENVDFTKATIFDEIFQRESFDVVLALNILHLVEDAGKAVQRIDELLKPGGMVITTTATMGELKIFIKIIIRLLIKTGLAPKIRFFKIPELENLLTGGNFQIIEAECLNRNKTEYFIAAKKK